MNEKLTGYAPMLITSYLELPADELNGIASSSNKIPHKVSPQLVQSPNEHHR